MKELRVLVLFGFVNLFLFNSCKEKPSNHNDVKIVNDTLFSDFHKDEMLKPAAFDTIIDNKKVSLYWIESDN
ncbi:hypothetical protein DSM00_1966, partial [Leeuwenhoekiella aequorea]